MTCNRNRKIEASRRSFARLFVVAALAFALTGCLSTEGLEPPGVTVVDLAIVEATLFETTLDVSVRIFNDNPEPLILDGAVIKLDLDGLKVGKGASSERLEVPRLGSVVQRFEVHLNHLAVATRIRGILESQVVDYGVTGKVYVVQPSGSVRRMPVESQGTIDFRAGAEADQSTEIAPD
jgi:LEA14-like dessication related protein